MNKLLYFWHSFLDMPKKDQEWHSNDINDEYKEYLEEKKLLKKWSELSDVIYTHSRAEWSGHKLDYPLHKKTIFLGLLYMYPKYTLRYAFYRKAGHTLNKNVNLKEVRNPKKIFKLKIIANKYGLDEDQFIKTCQKMLRHWILLP